jgi:HAAS domain-containing protein
MNDTIQVPTPDVATFVAQVRARLADLTEEEREELVGGLEADLGERLAEGETDLGDPATYAAELRAAAGLEPIRRAPRPHLPPRQRVEGWLDGARSRLDELAATRWGAAEWSFLVSLRPLWWFFRAWLAVQLIDMSTGSDMATPVPTLMGVWPGVLVTVLFTVVSVQIGRGLWWPGSRKGMSLAARLVLLALNSFAFLVAPVVLGQFPGAGAYDYSDELSYRPSPGLQDRGTFVTNVFPYDAQGRPLTGVQLFDQDGRPLTVNRDARLRWSDQGDDRVARAYPWYNGDQRLWNVFPLPQRTTGLTRNGTPPQVSPRAWDSTNPPALPSTPLAVVPPVALPTPAESPTAPESAPSASPGVSPSADSEKPRSR